MSYENKEDFRPSWYSLTANRHVKTLGVLQGAVNADVCVIGGGFTGISAALALAERGYTVTLLEAGPTPAPSASGRNGGHVQRGFPKPPDWIAARHGLDTAKMMNDVSLEGIALIKRRIATYGIDCDYHDGIVTAALQLRHLDEFRAEIESWHQIGHEDLQLLDIPALQEMVKSPDYIGGIYDPASGHFHPYNYALGIAAAAIASGVAFYTDTAATRIEHGISPVVHTAQGKVTASHVIVAGAADLPEMRGPNKRAIDVTAHIIVTEPLDDAAVAATLPANVAVADARFVMNYYRRTADNRLLFGGNCNYTNIDHGFEQDRLKKRLEGCFPQLTGIRVDHCWHGPLNLTVDRMPALGRLAPNVLYAHGFGGHGVASTNILGQILAETVAGTAERFDVFARLRHLPFPGGDISKRPLFVLGMWWYQLRDLLTR